MRTKMKRVLVFRVLVFRTPQKQPFFFKVTSFIRSQTGQQKSLNEKFRLELNIK